MPLLGLWSGGFGDLLLAVVFNEISRNAPAELTNSPTPGQAGVLCHDWLHAPKCSSLVEQ